MPAPDGNPAGFNVDLARLICEEIKATCTIQARRFDTLLDALNDNRGDAVIASIAPTADDAPARRFHRSLLPHAGALRRPPRQPDRRGAAGTARGHKIAVVAGTAHEAYLKAMFTEAELRPIRLPKRRGRRCATRTSTSCSATASRSRSGLTAPIPAGCCVFRGGPFLESRFFGEGIGIAVKRGNDLLRQALNWALFQHWEKGISPTCGCAISRSARFEAIRV